MNREHQLTYCKVCKNQKMDINQGLICSLTGLHADFEEECPYFDEDADLKQKQESRRIENVLFDNMASRGLRFANFLLDSLAFLIFAVVFGFLLGVIFVFYYPPGIELVDNMDRGAQILLNAFLGITFFTLFETTTGRTPGKFVTGTRVVRTDGSQPEFNTILLRSFYRYVPLEPFSFFGSEPTGWHDRWSETLVIKHKAIPMEWKPQGYYPGVGQSFAIVGLAILLMVVFSPFLFLAPAIGENFSFFLYYIIAVGFTFWVAHKWRKKHTSLGNYSWNFRNISLIPVLAVATITLHMGVVAPLISIIPVPEGLDDLFIAETSGYGLFGVLTIVVAAPVLEELIYRGIIQEGLMHRLRPIGAIVLTSLLFGFIHFNPWQFTAAFIAGLFIGWVYYYTRDIILAITIHLVNNLFVVVTMWSSGQMVEDRTNTVLDYFSGFILTWILIILSITVLVICIVYLQQRLNLIKSSSNKEEDPLDSTEVQYDQLSEFH
jgi:uncharacterized protein